MILLSVILLALTNEVLSQSKFRDVTTAQGVVRGFNVDDSSIFSFYGIPYATAPTGEDKFKAPLPPPNWTDIFQATERNIICPQRQLHILFDNFLNLTRTIDCLRLNIFAPVVQETPLPVMVYIHGGAFQEGYGMLFSPIDLAKKGLITVNMNYRLGVHGFLCLGTELAPGNAGYKDIVAALKWVQNNIRNFGGDPENVSLGGCSSGGMAVAMTMVSPMAKGLFAKASTEGGGSLTNIMTKPLETAQHFANQFGVETNQNLTALENFYKSLTDDELNTGYEDAIGLGFFTCLEEHNIDGVEKFLGKIPIDIVRSGEYQIRPYLTGFTPMEGLQFISRFDVMRPVMEKDLGNFLPIDLKYQSDEHKNRVVEKVKNFYFPGGIITHSGFVEFFTDTIFSYPQLVIGRMNARNSASVYLYFYNFNGTVNLPTIASSPIWGPGHVAQSLYTQRYAYKSIYDKMTEEDLFIQERLLEMWANFFKYGAPVPSTTSLLNVDWSPMTAEKDYFLDINMEMSFGESPLPERMALWDEIYGNSANSVESLTSVLILSLLLVKYVL